VNLVAKAIDKTDKIKAQITKVYGGPVNFDALNVYESISLNTLPLTKPGTIWNKAVIDGGVLYDMAAMLKNGESVPVILQHGDNVETLPVGKVFYGDIRASGAGTGVTELRTLFYVPNTEPTIVNKIETGILDEVSVGIRTKHLACSECGWDYLGADASIMNFLELTCANGHQIGVNGVFAKGIGLDSWREMSLVNKGAADHPKILPPARAELNASAFDIKSVVLHATAGREPNKGDSTMSVEDLATAKANLIIAERDRDAAKTEVTALTAKVTTLTAEVAEVKKNLESAKNADTEKLKTELKTATDGLASVNEFLTEIAEAALVATGKAKTDCPKDTAGLVKTIKDARATLAINIPVGGRANAAVGDANKPQSMSLDAFKTRK